MNTEKTWTAGELVEVFRKELEQQRKECRRLFGVSPRQGLARSKEPRPKSRSKNRGRKPCENQHHRQGIVELISKDNHQKRKNFMTKISANKNEALNFWRWIVVLAVAVMFPRQKAMAGQAPVSLGAAAKIAVLAATTVTSSGTTTVNGHLGVSPGTAVTGSLKVSGMIQAGGQTAARAQSDLTAAYNDVAKRTVDALTVAGNLGGLTLTPGLYKSSSSLEISSGDLTLDARGDTNAVFIFQMASTLSTTMGRQVILSGGARAANIYWQVGSSATLGTISVFKGNILALTSITLQNGAAVEGRLLARTAAVTLDTNTITLPAP